MKHKIFILLFTFVLTLSLGSFERVLGQVNTKFVELVDIQGNRIYTDEDILKYIKTKQRQKLAQITADEDLKTLQSLDFLDKRNVKLIVESVSKNKVAVIFQVRELPIIKIVEIDGLKYLTKEEILNELRNDKIEVEKPYDYEKMCGASKRISAYLAERGFFDVKITLFEEQLSATTIRIGFLIDELPNDDNEEEENGIEN